MAIEITLELVLGIIGTVTALGMLFFTLWERMQEKPDVKISDVLVYLEKKAEDKVVGNLSFNIDNLGERSTTITRIILVMGGYVDTIEGLRNLPTHSSVRYPEKEDSKIELVSRLKELKDLTITVHHTHGTSKRTYSIPQVSEWDKNALWKGGPIVLIP